ncbi:MAG TPA: Ig-like domain-containing protein [Gemmatimonadaceae bacterium]|nr:Ig-like domain-containing protein [Gemmatimonadaceae bacterium]
MSGVRQSRRAGVPAIRFGALVAALIAAGCDNPSSSNPERGLVLRTRMPAALEGVGPAVAAQLVPFDRVRLVLTRLTGARAADVSFPVDAAQDPIQLSLDVPLGLNVPLLGELFTLIVECIDSNGAAVYRGGPVPVLVKPGTATPPVDIQLAYVGGGSVATVLQIVPNTLSVLLGQAFSFTATAFDAQGNPVDAPIVWSVLDPLLATLTSPLGGAGSALGLGTARLVAAIPDGPADTALLNISPLPVATRLLELVSGGGQSGFIGALLGDPIVVRVVDEASQPLSGIPVQFSASNGGILGTPSVLSGSGGLAQTTWTLGSLLGTQRLTATAEALTGAPLSVPATGLSLPVVVATALELTTSVASTIAGTILTDVVVRAVDDAGSLVTSYTSPITLALGNNPGGAMLLGKRTVTPTNGVATFDDLSIQKAASGYSLVATAQGLTNATSNSFSITNAAAAVLSLVSGNNQSALVGALLGSPLSVRAADAFGNPVAGVPVAWAVALGGGLLGSPSSQTNASGVATNTWTLGLLSGLQRATASANGLSGSPNTFSATGLALPVVTRVLQLVSGGGQSGLIGALLGEPIVVRVVDEASRPISGIPISFSASNGGILGTPSPVSNSNGLAQTTWTLGSLLGTQTLTANADGLTGQPLAVPATGLPLPVVVATALELTTTVASTVAGTTLTDVTVRAVDDAGRVVPSYANPITLALGNNPGGATLLGKRTVTPTNGVATFDDLSIQKAASGYSLVATAQGLTNATSNSFSITNAAASVMSIVSGNNQSAVLGALLGSPLSVRVTDAFANPVAGVPVAWAVSLGGGLLGSPTSQTNSSGIATNTWTLGLLAGLQRATASANGLSGSPAVFSATGLLGLPLDRARGRRTP